MLSAGVLTPDKQSFIGPLTGLADGVRRHTVGQRQGPVEVGSAAGLATDLAACSAREGTPPHHGYLDWGDAMPFLDGDADNRGKIGG